MKTFMMSDIYRHLRAAYDKQFRIPDGAKFKKLFEGEPYPGKTTNFNDEDNSYSVLYDDGDNEDLDFIELREILEDPAVIVYPAVMPRAFPTESQVTSVVSAHKKSKSQGAAVKNPILR